MAPLTWRPHAKSTHPTPSSSPALPTALPTSVAWLGYGGLPPFAALAGIGWWGRAPLWGTALLAYGAVILSFVGALHWGLCHGAGRAERPRTHAPLLWSGAIAAGLACRAAAHGGQGRPCSSWGLRRTWCKTCARHPARHCPPGTSAALAPHRHRLRLPGPGRGGSPWMNAQTHSPLLPRPAPQHPCPAAAGAHGAHGHLATGWLTASGRGARQWRRANAPAPATCCSPRQRPPRSRPARAAAARP